MTVKKTWAWRRARLKRNAVGLVLLWLMSLAYAAIVLLRRKLYETGILKSRRLPVKIVCIGNITTGGTGKTPAVLLAAQTLRKRNHAVAIVSRGYGRAFRRGEVTTLLDEDAPHWTECGDEPWMMHQALAGQKIPILVCPDRARAAEQAQTFYHSRVVILDDGFQHLRLQRDLDIVLINAADPFGGGHALPLGNLREPVSTLARAGMIIITHADMVTSERLDHIKKLIQEVNETAPILESTHKADFLLDVRAEKKERLSLLDGRDVVALSGIASPESFEDQLGRIGAKVVQRWRYPDHHPYTPRELKSLERVRHGAPVVTTLKDFTRFPKGWTEALGEGVYVLAIKLEIVKGRAAWSEALGALAGGAPALEGV